MERGEIARRFSELTSTARLASEERRVVAKYVFFVQRRAVKAEFLFARSDLSVQCGAYLLPALAS